jgi:hypothetical protein
MQIASISVSSQAALGLAAAALALGCGDESQVRCTNGAEPPACVTSAPAESGVPLEPETTPEPSGDPEPAYLLGTRVFADDAPTTSYFSVVSGLDASVTLNQDEAIEVAGSAKLYSAYDLGWFAVGSGEEPTITRYELDAAGTLVEGPSVSFFNEGVTGLWDTLYFVSPTKAYYPDRENGQLVVWNPTSMLVTGAIQLPDTLRDGYLALYGYAPIWRGTELLISVGWFDWDVNDTVLPETGLVVVDTATDSVVRVDTDSRCGGVTQPVTLPNGDAYLVSSALAGAAHRVGRLETAPCVLRIPAGSSQVDPDYAVSLEAITGNALAGEPVPANDAVFLRAFDDSLATIEGPMLTYEFTGQTAWRWLRWNPATNETVPMLDIPPSTADVTWFQVDGRVYGSETTADYSQTTLLELSANAGAVRAITVPGFLHGVARIR